MSDKNCKIVCEITASEHTKEVCIFEGTLTECRKHMKNIVHWYNTFLLLSAKRRTKVWQSMFIVNFNDSRDMFITIKRGIMYNVFLDIRIRIVQSSLL